MTTKTKKSQVKSTPKPKVDTPVVEARQNKKSYSLPTFKNKVEKPHVYRLVNNGGKDKRGNIKYPVSYMVKAEEISISRSRSVPVAVLSRTPFIYPFVLTLLSATIAMCVHSPSVNPIVPV